MEAPEDIAYALGEYLSELCGLLEMDGYSVSTEHLEWKPVQIQICTDYMGRIIDNLITNIKKYASPDTPVRLSSAYHSSLAGITIENTSVQPSPHVHGTGIGVKNIYSMMARMNGTCSVESKAGRYSITLAFPIAS